MAYVTLIYQTYKYGIQFTQNYFFFVIYTKGVKIQMWILLYLLFEFSVIEYP